MQYGKCECGSLEFWGSGMVPATCSPCEKCGTLPWGGEVREHEFYVEVVEADDGDHTLSRCRWCMQTKRDIEKGD